MSASASPDEAESSARKNTVTIPVIIQLDNTEIGDSGEAPCSAPVVRVEDGGFQGALKLPLLGGVKQGSPNSNSLLGADLIQKSASLAMPPPTSTTVKKARNLVSPGMSMVKWMKLQENKVRPPTRKKIPLSEIAKHNTESDCWMGIRNCVYDVTEYIPYHPGGVPELMKGAGKDGTALFNEIHRWVNFDSILRSCLLGYLLIDVGESFDETDEDTEVNSTALVPTSSARLKLPLNKFYQDEQSLYFQVDVVQDSDVSEDSWSVSVLNRERLLLKVILKPPDLWMAHVKLLEALNDDLLVVNFQNCFKRAVITLKKPSKEKWKSLGVPLQDNNRLLDSRQCEVEDFSTGIIVDKQQLNYDVVLLGVQTASSVLLGIPVGFHVRIRLQESEVARKYTPVLRRIVASSEVEGDESRKTIYFIIKIYPDGFLTKELGQLNINSQLEVGIVAGRYDHSFLRNCDTLALFAGGSGVTPFVRILDFLRKRSFSYPVKRILFIFFNHTEADIVWGEQWLALSMQWNTFHYIPVITKPNSTWSGFSGRVNASLFESILSHVFTKEQGVSQVELDKCHVGSFKAMICGSSGFNEACVTMLKAQTLVEVTATDDDVFIF